MNLHIINESDNQWNTASRNLFERCRYAPCSWVVSNLNDKHKNLTHHPHATVDIFIQPPPWVNFVPSPPINYNGASNGSCLFCQSFYEPGWLTEGESSWFLTFLTFVFLMWKYHTYICTAGTGWCFPRKNPLRDTFCDFQRVFPTETHVFLRFFFQKHFFVFPWESPFGNHKMCLLMGFSGGNTTQCQQWW